MLGSDVVDALEAKGWRVASPTIKELDITYMPDLEKLNRRDFGDFDWIVNCAAYTAVDQAESDSMSALKVNAIAPGSLAAICKGNAWKLLHVSTDFVFDGEADTPYTEESATHPLGSYGRSKLLGEQNVLRECASSVVLRTAWLFGPNGKSFPKTMIEAWKAGKDLKVVNDQTGSPSYTADVAATIAECLRSEVAPGIYHAAGPDVMTWFDLARLTLETFAAQSGSTEPITVAPVTTDEWPTPAKRPKYSALSSAKLNGLGASRMRTTKEALTEFCQRLHV